MADDVENTDADTDPPPVASPYAFMRRPMFIFSLLFLAWIFFGQAAQRFIPHHPAETASAPAVAQPNTQEAVTPKDAQIADLQHRLVDVEAKLKALENATTAPAKPYDDSAITAKIESLQTSLNTLQQAHSTETGDAAHLTEALHKQEEDIATLKAQLATTQTQALRRLSLMAAFESLKDAVMRGESFGEQLNRMNDLAKDDAPIQQLLAQFTPYSKDSAPTVVTLQSQFETLIPQALSPDASNSLTRHLQSMIRIRKVGEQQTGSDNEAIVARAEAKLKRGDVKASVDELKALSAPAAIAFAAWVDKAQAFLHIREALGALQPVLLQEKAASAETVTNAPATQ